MDKEALRFRAKNLFTTLQRPVNRIRYAGDEYYCPICDSTVSTFTSAGVIKRPNARCPICRSLERHRLVWMFFKEKTNLLDGKQKRMLHIAPEIQIRRKLEQVGNLDYMTADLMDPNVDIQMDITDIQYPDGTFDVIYCSHVFEHVPDDRKGMREFHRVLRSDGWAVLLVPITTDGETIEDPSITDPAERERLFGQRDHVRRYGPDYVDRLTEAGFKVTIFTSAEIVGEDNVERIGIPNEVIYYCTK